MTKQNILRVFGVISGTAGVVGFLYARDKLVDGGLYADQTGTSGRISNADAALLLLSILLVISAIVLFLITSRKRR